MICDEKEFTDRVHRINGQVTALDKMYKNRRTAQEILQQVVSVRSSLSSLATIIVEAEVKGCLPIGDTSTDSLSKLVETLFKVT
jgi:DNA-binding FrmR family transcriptional regulator